jgi:hypothetical protein
MKSITYFIYPVLFILALSCKNEETTVPKSYLTKNVIVIVMDGARFSETWGDSIHQNIPFLSGQLAKQGVINTRFYNDGPTYTTSGHTAITTGYYQDIDNAGNEIPEYPSFFQYFNKKDTIKEKFSLIISSKAKLHVLANCQFTPMNNKFLPSTSCGVNGLDSINQGDSITFKVCMKTLSTRHPQLLLVNFSEPDYSAHRDTMEGYLLGIRKIDEYVFRIWEYIQKDTIYMGRTTLFLTNDHGRHLDSISNGFISHGDGCYGCRHIFLYAFGPDFKQGVITDTKRGLVDLNATISDLLNIDKGYSQGTPMKELFK